MVEIIKEWKNKKWCCNCKFLYSRIFYDIDTSKPYGYSDQCRKNPPKNNIEDDPNIKDCDMLIGRYPQVAYHFWCGEFKKHSIFKRLFNNKGAKL